MVTRKTLIQTIITTAFMVTVMLTMACNKQASTASAPTVAYEVPKLDLSRTSTANSAGRYGKIVVSIDLDPQDLLPYNVNNGSKPYIYYNFYECLFDMEGADYIPVLAKGYTVVDDLHYDVEIYDYIYDHAGNHITADDVVYSYQVLIDSGYNFKWASFADIKKINDYTLRFTWTAPVEGVGDLEFPWCRTIIFSQAAYKSGNFATQPVGTGPYKVTNFVSGSNVVLEAVNNYWQTDKSKIGKRHEANVQTVQYDIITESSQHVIALKSGIIGFSEKVPNENLAEFEKSGDFNVYVAQGSFVYSLHLNNSTGNIGSDINFRKAVYYAIDNDACVVATNYTTLPAKAFGSSFFADYVTAWNTTPSYINTFDPLQAKEYLSKSGYKGETLVLMGTNSEVEKNLMTIIQSFLVNIGINTKIAAVDSVLQTNNIDDPSAWDLMVNKIGGGLQIGQWNRVLNYNEFASKKSFGFIHDETLQQKFLSAKNVNNHGVASMTDLHTYLLDNAYQYGIATGKLNLVYTNKIAELYLREKQYLLPGACTYYLD
jgi:ABC-type transport system substrate-binding protein